MSDTATKAFWAICEKCNHCWPAAYFPLEATKFAKIAKRAVCPKCGGRALVAKQDDGVLQEPAA